jgi:hypothetical protein
MNNNPRLGHHLPKVYIPHLDSFHTEPRLSKPLPYSHFRLNHLTLFLNKSLIQMQTQALNFTLFIFLKHNIKLQITSTNGFKGLGLHVGTALGSQGYTIQII